VEGQPEAAAALLDRLAAIFPGRLYVELHAWSRGGAPAKRTDRSRLRQGLAAGGDQTMCISARRMLRATRPAAVHRDGTFVSQTTQAVDPRASLQDRRRDDGQFADLPEAIENTVEIARRCAFLPKRREPICRNFVPESGARRKTRFACRPRLAWCRRLARHGRHSEEKTYHDRLQFELDVIIKMKFAAIS